MVATGIDGTNFSKAQVDCTLVQVCCRFFQHSHACLLCIVEIGLIDTWRVASFGA